MNCDHLDLHGLTHSFPTRRSSYLARWEHRTRPPTDPWKPDAGSRRWTGPPLTRTKRSRRHRLADGWRLAKSQRKQYPVGRPWQTLLRWLPLPQETTAIKSTSMNAYA